MPDVNSPSYDPGTAGNVPKPTTPVDSISDLLKMATGALDFGDTMAIRSAIAQNTHADPLGGAPIVDNEGAQNQVAQTRPQAILKLKNQQAETQSATAQAETAKMQAAHADLQGHLTAAAMLSEAPDQSAYDRTLVALHGAGYDTSKASPDVDTGRTEAKQQGAQMLDAYNKIGENLGGKALNTGLVQDGIDRFMDERGPGGQYYNGTVEPANTAKTLGDQWHAATASKDEKSAAIAAKQYAQAFASYFAGGRYNGSITDSTLIHNGMPNDLVAELHNILGTGKLTANVKAQMDTAMSGTYDTRRMLQGKREGQAATFLKGMTNDSNMVDTSPVGVKNGLSMSYPNPFTNPTGAAEKAGTPPKTTVTPTNTMPTPEQIYSDMGAYKRAHPNVSDAALLAHARKLNPSFDDFMKGRSGE